MLNYYNSLLKLVKTSKIFLALFSFFVFSSMIILMIYGKSSSHLYIDSIHTPWTDTFFSYYTYVGDGWIYGILILALCVRWVGTYGLSVRALGCFLMAGLGAQALKHVFETPRPKSFFGESALHTVTGVAMLSSHSMPSGHSATAFSMFLLIVFIANEKGKNSTFLQVVLYLLAWLVGMSRIYLSQHFLEDVIVGSIIGVVGTLTFCAFADVVLSGKSFYNKSI